MIVNLRRLGVKKYKKKIKRLVTYGDKSGSFNTAEVGYCRVRKGNQPQEASNGGLIGPPVVEIWISM